MSDYISEALLEMHFHGALKELFQRYYGARILKLYKPTPQQEKWVGFDQAWVKTDLSHQQLETELRGAISNQSTTINSFYLGFFLQFKKISIITRRSYLIPTNIGTPYYRSELYLEPNRVTLLSQHEVLKRLSLIQNASVYYACAMVFDLMDIYEKPDVEKLKMVPVNTAPQNLNASQRHFILFQNQDSIPIWCSEPQEGNVFSFKQWATGKAPDSPKKQSGEEILEMIKNIQNVLRLTSHQKWQEKELVQRSRDENMLKKSSLKEELPWAADRAPTKRELDKFDKEEAKSAYRLQIERPNIIPDCFTILKLEEL